MHMAANFFACFRFGRLIRPKHVLPWPLPLLRRSIWTCSAHVPVLHSQETPDVKHQSWVWKIRFLHNFPLGMAKHRTSDSMSFFCTFSRAVAVCFQSEAKIHQVPDCATINFCPTWNDYPFLGERFETSKQIVTIQLDASKIHDDSPGKPLWVECTSAKKLYLLDRHGSFQIIFQLFMMNIYVETSVIPIQSQWISFFKTYISTVKSEHTTNIPRNIRNIPGYLKIPLISQRMPYLDCLDVQFLCLATRLASAFCATGGSCDHIALAEAGELQSAKTTNVKHDPQDPCMVYILT